MPMRNSSYPPRWSQLSLFLRTLAKGCEQCGAPGGAWIQRHKGNPLVWQLCGELDGETQTWKRPQKVVLSVHHIGMSLADGTPGNPHDKADCRPENLIVLCSRCHLMADLSLHIENARRTRHLRKLREKESSGQMRLGCCERR